jgi:two-component system, OmpR family, phosphate regulon sensor histidine kinase PhoR
MTWRILTFLAFQFTGGLIGWWLGREHGLAIGLVIGSLLWLAFDTLRAARVLRWLREAELAEAPAMRGMWGEAADRVRRALRLRQTEVLEAQGRLQEFLAAIQASPNGVVLLDPQGRIEWCNQTAADQFGFDLQRDILQQIGNLVRDPGFMAYYSGGDYSQEIVIPGPNSLPSRPVKLSVQVHPYGMGRRLLLTRDVTAVQQAEVMRRDFVANVSHEIRTPLTVLMGFVETLQNLPLDAQERSRYLGLMARQAHRMQTLVDDLLTLSRLEGSPLPGVGEWSSLGALIAHCEQEGRALSDVLGKSHELRFDESPALEIAGSSNELQSAMSNLVSNAIRYTPVGGSIQVRWRLLADGRGEFSVRDTGPGIAPEHLSRLTERFYRVDRSRSRETGGTGLGLAIVKHVVQRHGAELTIDSAPGAGSTFAIKFPASRLRAAKRTAGTSVRLARESLAG